MLSLPEEIQPKLGKGRAWLDCVFVLILIFLQNSFLPSVWGETFYLDLVTPWLVIFFVQQSLPRGLIVALVAVFTLETHATVPQGTYFCAYWAIMNAVYLVKDTFSWRHANTWMITFFLSELWLIASELFVATILRGELVGDFNYYLSLLLRLNIAVLVGLVACKHWLGLFEEET